MQISARMYMCVCGCSPRIWIGFLTWGFPWHPIPNPKTPRQGPGGSQRLPAARHAGRGPRSLGTEPLQECDEAGLGLKILNHVGAIDSMYMLFAGFRPLLETAAGCLLG